MSMKTKVLFIAIILLASVFLSGCVDDSAENEKTDVGEVTEKTIQAQGQEESLDNETGQRITPEEAETNENTPVNEVTPENEASATEKVSTASSSGGKSSSFSSSSEEADKITVTDDLGREITVPYPCERTVFLVENAMNSMYAVGGADEISGIGAVWFEDKKAPFFRAIDTNYDKKRLSNGSEQPSTETIATANPQVVFLWASDWESADIKAIEENLKVPVYGVFIDSLDDLQRQMKTLSKLIGNEERGDEVIGIMDKYMKKVTDITGNIPAEEKPTVYWMWGSDGYGTAGLNSTANDLIGRAGGVNVLNNWTNETKSVEHPTLNLETLLELNPEVIYMWNNEKLDPINITSGNTVDGIDYSTWKEISAVKNKRVYEISDPFVYDFHSPRLPLAMMHVAKDLHPDKFANFNLTQEADNYYVEVYGVHYPGFEKADGSEQTSITVTDDLGREITVPYPCERTVFLVENAMNSMYAVGGADKISGIGAVWFEDKKAPFFRAIDTNYDKKRLSNGSEQPSTETIATANPQVVFLWASDWESADIKAIEENLKVPVYGVFIDSLDDLQRQMKTLSKLIGNEERGDEVIEIMDKYMKKVTDITGTVPVEEKPTVYWMWGSDGYGTAGLNSTANDLIGRAGGVNVLNNWTNETKSVEHPTLNLETLLELNPEVIYMWNNEKLDPVNITSGDTVDGIDFSTWKEISAVKNGRVYEISDPFVYDFHSPRLPLAMMHVAKDLHPDKFANLSLTQEADNYYVEVYGVHYPGFEKA